MLLCLLLLPGYFDDLSGLDQVHYIGVISERLPGFLCNVLLLSSFFQDVIIQDEQLLFVSAVCVLSISVLCIIFYH